MTLFLYSDHVWFSTFVNAVYIQERWVRPHIYWFAKYGDSFWTFKDRDAM